MESSEAPLSIAGLLQLARARLLPLESARLDAEVLLAWALRGPRSALMFDPERILARELQAQYLTWIARRARGEPLAYITGEREFWSLPLTVSPAVLVPRPETELLVERALALLDERPAYVADLGTGSGAIALALARERPQWRITATDQSAEALSIAQQNASALGIATVQFLRGDWLAPLAGQRFALIVSNPPYIAEDDPALMDAALQYEPQVALVSGPKGLWALEQIIREAPGHLLTEGILILEHGSEQAAPVRAALVDAGFAHVRCHRDLAGHERVTEARWLTRKQTD